MEDIKAFPLLMKNDMQVLQETAGKILKMHKDTSIDVEKGKYF